jgi:hypothetical protein
MESFETNHKPSHAEKSNAIHKLVDTESALQMLDAAFCSLRHRKDALHSELKKPGISADRQRLHELLREWEAIHRALRGQSPAGATL